MKAIGFRAEPSVVSWAVVEGSTGEPILNGADKLKAPASFDEAAALKWFREQTQRLVQAYLPSVAVVRSPETFFPRQPKYQSLYQRCRVEGVLVETLYSCGVPVLTGAMATISSKLGSKAAKHYLPNSDFRGLDWSKCDDKKKEAILAAASALPGE